MGFFGRLFKPNIGKMRRRRDVDGLSKALKHKDWQIRQQAAKALGEIGGFQATDALIDLFNNSDHTKRPYIIGILGKMSEPRVINALIDALQDRHLVVNQSAAKALHPHLTTPGMLRDGEAIEPLERILMIDSLSHEVNRTKQSTIKALGEIGGKRVVDVLIRFSEDRTRVVSSYLWLIAIEALGRLGDPRAIEPLIRSLAYYQQENSIDGLVETMKALVKLGWKPSDDAHKQVRFTYLLLSKKWDDLLRIGTPAYLYLSSIWSSVNYPSTYTPYRLELDDEIKDNLDEILDKIRPLYEAERVDELLRSVRTRFPMIGQLSKIPIVEEEEWSQALISNPSIDLKFAHQTVHLKDLSWLEGDLDEITLVLACCGRLDWKHTILAEEVEVTQSTLTSSVPIFLIKVMSEAKTHRFGNEEWDSWSGGMLYVIRISEGTYRYFFDGGWVPGNYIGYSTYTVPKHPFIQKQDNTM